MPSLPPLSLSPAELAYLHTSLSSTPPIRPDGRTTAQFRPITAETDVLPSANGSAHLSFSDGSEGVVGVKADVERTASTKILLNGNEEGGEDVRMSGSTDTKEETNNSGGDPSWIDLSIDISGLRDDDSLLIFLSYMLREALLSSTSSTSSLLSRLAINSRWHFKLSIDILLLSPLTSTSSTSLPLPLLSLTTHLALLSTRLPRLKSEGEEDPLFDDDWDASTFLYSPPPAMRPPITMLIVLVSQNVLHDPSREELAVADAVFAVSMSVGGNPRAAKGDVETENIMVLSVRTLNPASRDTFPGNPSAATADGSGGADAGGEGIWKPRLGGVKREALKKIFGGGLDGVARDVVEGLEGFVGRGKLS
ncbi:MAG: hypothetical protein Q9227_000915 [Pyrenula ochraceoflavens]